MIPRQMDAKTIEAAVEGLYGLMFPLHCLYYTLGHLSRDSVQSGILSETTQVLTTLVEGAYQARAWDEAVWARIPDCIDRLVNLCSPPYENGYHAVEQVLEKGLTPSLLRALPYANALTTPQDPRGRNYPAKDLLDSRNYRAAKIGGFNFELFEGLGKSQRSPAVKVLHDAYVFALHCCVLSFEQPRDISARPCSSLKNSLSHTLPVVKEKRSGYSKH
ncbi:hypothetical protein FA13DRAFT_829251 [Coprinellus micaceus]|uniref:Uncharacterized protein n=1 Tax=Coprinellus micaceus TaxID=71717 RepID=A0A4Y7T1N0_COPMI|nr:hypothetical protein FA13DRAFT_829251 [Coprinellus micaceus]